MLRLSSSSHNKGQSMVMYSSGMKHAPSVVSPNDNGQSMVIHPLGMKSALSVVIVS